MSEQVTQFRSAVSGLWYEHPEAAGAIKQGGDCRMRRFLIWTVVWGGFALLVVSTFYLCMVISFWVVGKLTHGGL